MDGERDPLFCCVCRLCVGGGGWLRVPGADLAWVQIHHVASSD